LQNKIHILLDIVTLNMYNSVIFLEKGVY